MREIERANNIDVVIISYFRARQSFISRMGTGRTGPMSTVNWRVKQLFTVPTVTGSSFHTKMEDVAVWPPIIGKSCISVCTYVYVCVRVLKSLCV